MEGGDQGGMIIPLAQLVKAKRPRLRRLVLRPIEPTASQAAELYAIHYWVVQQWREFISVTLAPSYERPSPFVADDDGQKLQWLIDQKNADINSRIIYQTEKMGRWVTKFGTWHGAKTISAVNSATGVDIEPFIRLGNIRDQLDAAIRENTNLISGINADAKLRVEQVLFDSFAMRKTKAATVKALAEAMGITQRRARRIATDQTHKLGSILTQIRQQQMGFEKYKWITRGDDRVRPAHRSRNGRIFRWDKPPYDGHPGYPIMCRCIAEAYFDFED